MASHRTARPADTTDGVLDALADLLTAADAATALVGLDGSVLTANEAALDRFGDLRGANAGAERSQLTIGDLLEQVPRRLFEEIGGGSWRGDLDLDGTGATTEATVVVRHDPEGPHGGTVAVLCRPTPAERARVRELERRIGLDDLTGLPDRAVTIEAATQLLTNADPNTAQLGVIVIDVERLRDVNDAYGCEAGDHLIATTAERLASALPPTGFLGRTGGSEFAILCPTPHGVEFAAELVDRIRLTLGRPTTIDDRELDASVSVGVSVSRPDTPPSPAGAADLIAQAGAAARDGRRGFATYSPDLRRAALARTELTAALSRALSDDELVVEYQPLFASASEVAEAAEARVRWVHPVRGTIDADELLATAERTGAIVDVGNWALAQALTAARGWIDAGTVGSRFAVHVDVSRPQLVDAGFTDDVVELLRANQLRPPQLVLAVRETTLAGDTGDVTRAVEELRRVGVRIALDNVGTGSDTLSLLTDIGADVLKLDGALALPSASPETDTRVLRALVLLGHALNMEVVAERVTDGEQLRRLRGAGCDMLQGDVIGAPTAPEGLITRMHL